MLNKLVFLSALSVVALSGAAQAATFNPGTYTVVSKGNGGEVPVTVTFTKNAIESVKIGANKETPGIGSIAIEKLPKAIVGSERCERRLHHKSRNPRSCCCLRETSRRQC